MNTPATLFHADPAVMDERSDDSSRSSSPTIEDGLFFIVGAPRSGTTLLQTILSRHTRLHIPPETEFFMSYGQETLDRLGFDRYIRAFLASQRWKDQGLRDSELRAELNRSARSRPTARDVFLAMMALHARKQAKPRIGEKSPHHCRSVRAILAAFPDARIIHLVRDPRDVVASRLRMPWSRGSHLAVAREWRRIIEHHLELRRELPPATYLELRYESLAQDPESSARLLCNFLGESFEPAMLAASSTSPTFAPREAEWKANAAGAVHTASIASYRSQLTPRQIAGIQRETAAAMSAVGYAPDAVQPESSWAFADFKDRCRDAVGKFSRSLRKHTGR